MKHPPKRTSEACSEWRYNSKPFFIMSVKAQYSFQQ